ncbi:hypothetical protein N7281_04560 [Rickettsia hoogstraalii]|uniref:hypothetical protein n=1 Tax=Rickettsia hoogstraalii TaxID=467174 RepID=UPI00225893A1|nr:hypothetical protein [Rickettsia hoogstraalii]MCX4084120.1 hypothetical protein [Rickettsia hoogstraalii]
MQKAKIKVDIINKYKQEYKNGIDIKIKEAKDLISKEITPEIDNVGAEIDNKIELLINEVIALQAQTQEEQKELIEKKQELENALVLQSLFASFKILGQVVSFLSPAGAVAGSAIGVGSAILF